MSSAVLFKMSLTWAGVNSGFTESTNAAAPATMGAEKDVPPFNLYLLLPVAKTKLITGADKSTLSLC